MPDTPSPSPVLPPPESAPSATPSRGRYIWLAALAVLIALVWITPSAIPLFRPDAPEAAPSSPADDTAHESETSPAPAPVAPMADHAPVETPENNPSLSSFIPEPPVATPPPAPVNPEYTTTEDAPATAEQPLASEPLATELQNMLAQITRKEEQISTLQCALNLHHFRYDANRLNATLTQCYAVLFKAGVSQGDMRTLADAATQGIPDLPSLQQAFQAAIVPALKLRSREHVEESRWYRFLRERIVDAITIRKIGWQEGKSVEAVIGRAEVHLKNHALNDAYQEILSLPDDSKKPFGEWLRQMEIWRAYMRMIDRLKQASDADPSGAMHGN